MSEATITFKLPEEQSDFDTARNGHKFATVLWDVDNELRSIIKYGDDRGTYQDKYSRLIERIGLLRSSMKEALAGTGWDF